MKPPLKNVHVFSKSASVEALLTSYGVIEKGHFEYKKLAADGTRMRGEYYINFRMLTTPQEMELAPLYWEAINEFFSTKKETLIIVGVAYATIAFAKIIQTLGYNEHHIEYAYAEKRDGKLGLYDVQAQKCRGKHILFLEDVCNNGASIAELSGYCESNKEQLGILAYSVLYGVHRGHTFPEVPQNEIYAMSVIYAPAYHVSELPSEVAARPLKAYKK
jgi:orotate phosphoribosyltransferase